jgi:hypothetical protein
MRTRTRVARDCRGTQTFQAAQCKQHVVIWHAYGHIWCQRTCFQLLDLRLALGVAHAVPRAWRRRRSGRGCIHSILLGTPRQQRAVRAADTALQPIDRTCEPIECIVQENAVQVPLL